MIKQQINARVPETIAKTIQSRAAGMEESIGGYLGLIAQQWFAAGCPAVNDYEARIRARAEEVAKKVA
jgi:hypothetical protein